MLLDILGSPLTSNKLNEQTGKGAFGAAEEAIRVFFTSTHYLTNFEIKNYY